MSGSAVVTDATRQAFERLWQGANSGRVGDYELIAQSLERARVVGVLDAWAEKASGGCGWRMSDLSPIATPTCTIYPTSLVKDALHFTAATPDAARAAAAKAIESGEV